MALTTKTKTLKSGRQKETIQLRIEDREIKALLRTFGRMDDIAKNDMKKIAQDLSEYMANEVRAAGNRAGYPRQNRAVLETLRISKSDKIPNFQIGGSRRITSDRRPAGNLIIGAEFGSNDFRFAPRTPKEGNGNRGYFIFPTLKRLQPEILKRWLDGYKFIRDAWVSRTN